MHVRDLLFKIAERGITLRCGRTEYRFNAKPTSALTSDGHLPVAVLQDVGRCYTDSLVVLRLEDFSNYLKRNAA